MNGHYKKKNNKLQYITLSVKYQLWNEIQRNRMQRINTRKSLYQYLRTGWMPYRICNLIYNREIWIIKDSDITFLMQQGTLTEKVKLRCDKNRRYFLEVQSTLVFLYIWIWKIGYENKTIYEIWQTAKCLFVPLFHCSSIFSFFPCIHIVPMAGVTLWYNQVI